MRFVANYFRLKREKRRLIREAFAALVRAWYLVRFSRFNRYSRHLGTARPGPYLEELDAPPRTLHEVYWAVNTAGKPFGDRFTCLMRAMAGKKMLDRRGIRNSITLGAKLEALGGDAQSDGMKAHAWLNVGDIVLLGEEEREGYIPVTHYVSP